MPQLDLLTLLDQFLISYFLFVFLHFFVSTGPVPAIFEALYARHLLFEELSNTNQAVLDTVLRRKLRSEEQHLSLARLTSSLAVQ